MRKRERKKEFFRAPAFSPLAGRERERERERERKREREAASSEIAFSSFFFHRLFAAAIAVERQKIEELIDAFGSEHVLHFGGQTKKLGALLLGCQHFGRKEKKQTSFFGGRKIRKIVGIKGFAG